MKNGLTMHPRAGLLLHADTRRDRIDLVHAPSGMIVGTIGRGGDSDVGLSAPQGLAIDDQDRLWICDTGNARVMVMTTRQRLAVLFTVGRRGTEPGEFLSPVAVAFDSAGNAYVVDSELNRVQVFDPAGRLIGATDGTGHDDQSQQGSPTAIAITNETLFVGSGDRHIRRIANPRRRRMSC